MLSAQGAYNKYFLLFFVLFQQVLRGPGIIRIFKPELRDMGRLGLDFGKHWQKLPGTLTVVPGFLGKGCEEQNMCQLHILFGSLQRQRKNTGMK